MNRYYSNAYGRFMTPDPYPPSAKAGNPQSWNRYAYVIGDPVNNNDPRGLDLPEEGDDGDGDDDWGEGGGFSYDGCVPSWDPIWGYWGCGIGPVPVQTFGGAPATFTVTGYSRTGTKENTITTDLNDILNQVLTGGCAKWLTGSDFSASQLIPALENAGLGGPTYGYGALNSNTTAAFVGNTNTNGTPIAGLPADASITVNTNGAFFNSGFTVGSGNTQYTGGTLQAQIFILVHELAHLVGAAGFQSDAGNSSAVASNNALVQKNCGSQIAGVQ